MVDYRRAAGYQRQRAQQCRVAIDPDHMQTVSETPRAPIAQVHCQSPRRAYIGASLRDWRAATQRRASPWGIE
jgi:hypothetical protein